MRPSFKLVIFALLILPIEARGQFRAAKCEVQPLWVSKIARSSNFGLMGTFENDGTEGSIIRSFRLESTPLIATVGMDYIYDSNYSKGKPKLYGIRLAIAVSDKEQKEIYESVESSEAETRYAKKWTLSVTKNVSLGDLVYMFTLRCWDAEGYVGKKPFF